MKSKHMTALLVIGSLAISACATDQYGNRRPLTDAEKGAIIGATSGALIGAATSKKRSKGALIGAVGGGLIGTGVGAYMDKQKQDLEKVLANERNSGAIEIEMLQQNIVRVTMTAQTAFAVNSSQISSGFYSTMDKIANVLVRYQKTELTVIGHTDNTGSDQYNQTLSERRAQSVGQYLSQKGVIPERLETYGKGESAPRASNATEAGRAANRRVEIFVSPIVAE